MFSAKVFTCEPPASIHGLCTLLYVAKCQSLKSQPLLLPYLPQNGNDQILSGLPKTSCIIIAMLLWWVLWAKSGIGRSMAPSAVRATQMNLLHPHCHHSLRRKKGIFGFASTQTNFTFPECSDLWHEHVGRFKMNGRGTGTVLCPYRPNPSYQAVWSFL